MAPKVSRPLETATVTRRRLRLKTPEGAIHVVDVPSPSLIGAAMDTATRSVTWCETFLQVEELEQEDAQKRKAVYLITLPHPRAAGRDDIQTLRAPEDFKGNSKAIANIIRDVFEHPVHCDAAAQQRTQEGGSALKLLRFVVFREFHKPDERGVAHVHYHIALQASASFRFMPYKRALLQRWRLASHWSCTHDGYPSAVRYGFYPTLKKPEDSLDKSPVAWQHEGQHPPLYDACKPGVTVEAVRKRRELAEKKASGEGKPEPRATELDIYTIIVRQDFRNTPDDPWAGKRLLQHIKDQGSFAEFALAWKLRGKLSSIIDDVWDLEAVGDDLRLLDRSRVELMVAAAQGPCVCQGSWRRLAEHAMDANGVDKAALCGQIWMSLHMGRHESTPTVVLMGRFGGEGKSFLLAPLKHVLGKKYIQFTPQPGSFPLLNLECKRAAVLDEWAFDNSVVPFSTQLMWFEGKSFPITRPQNKDYVGHVLYEGSAPVFITTKEKDLGPIVAAAAAATETGTASEHTMLLRRLAIHSFHVKLPVQKGVKIPECACCFAQLVMQYAAQAGLQ